MGAPTTGLISMPDARFNPDGTLQFGLSYADPYVTLSAAATLLPWLETNLGVTQINGVQPLADPQFLTGGYGPYKDKTSGLRVRLLSESAWRPAIALGVQDAIGTKLSEREYVVATKTLGEAQATLGYGRQQIDGAFGGLRYSPDWAQNWSLVAEYDASDYKSFKFGDMTGVANRKKGAAFGVEYRLGWMSAALTSQPGAIGIATYIAIPMDRAEWIPKTTEPEPYTKITPRPTLAQWEDAPEYKKQLYQALFRQSFKDVRMRYENTRLTLVLANARISEMGRAVGRAARTALLLSPLETTEIRITYTSGGLPVATYEFSDLGRLNRYFNGLLTRSEIVETISVTYGDPESYGKKDETDLLAALADPGDASVVYGNDGNFVSFKSQSAGLDQFQIKPTLSTYLNGPNVFQYSLGILGTYDRELAQRLFLNSGLIWVLYQNITATEGGFNNSTLPHVRSDFPEYYGGYSVKLDHLLLNRVYQTSERTYARVSGGYIEQMYAGAEGQWLYVPRGAAWALDLSVDAVQKRDFDGGFKLQDYQTVQALAALHYRLPYQATFTTRAGRFLAGDYGARFEIKRRFRIGMELGAWYTVTNAVDLGVDGTNYRDKGVFVSIPFDALLTNDTKVTTGFSLQPWTRDAGAMIRSPVDLYDSLEKSLMIDMHKADGLGRIGDVADDDNLPYLGSPMWDDPFYNFGKLTVQDWGDAPAAASQPGVAETALLGAGAIAAAGLFDASLDRAVLRHQGSRIQDSLTNVGKYLPFAALGGAGLAALSETDKRASNTGIAALEAGFTGLVVNEGLKYAVGRARPIDDKGTTDFAPFGRSDGSFPSNHTTVMWATVTPFAKEYDAPWLYGVAALVNAGRITSREHWLSDTLASSLLGYAIGDFFWQERRSAGKGPKVLVSPSGVALKWETK
jgi:membrane-associated phospholipid phosphatase